MEMVQLWVNLPAKFKMTAPRYQAIVSRDIPVVTLDNDAGTTRVIAGNFNGVKGAAETFTPVELWDINLKAGKSIELTVPNGHNAMLFIRSGKLTINKDKTVGTADLAMLAQEGSRILLDAHENTQLLLLGGEPIDEAIAAQGPFVMNSQEEVRQAMSDYRNGLMGRLDG